MLDGFGSPLKFILAPGQCHGVTQSYEIVEAISDSTVITDKGYDVNSFLTQLEDQECQGAFLRAKIERSLENMTRIYIKNDI